MRNLDPAAAELYRSWVESWRNLDGALMLSLFPETGEFVYQAEEFPKAFTSRSSLERYWTSVPETAIARIEHWEEESMNIMKLAPSVTLLHVLTKTRLVLHTPLAPPVAGVLRSTLILDTAHEEGARITHYHESRQLVLALSVG